jgi:ADP-ribosylglycohydrolase
MEKVAIIYGEKGIQEPPTPAAITDETQTSAAVAEALVEAGLEDLDTIMDAISRNLIAWSNSSENTRAPGHTVTEAVRTLEAGISWREAGVATAKGNGAAVRMAPIGFLYQHDPDRLREVAHACGIATHAHPSSDAAAIAAAYLVKLGLDGVPPYEYVTEVLRFTDGISDEFDTIMLRVGHVSEWTDEFAAITHIGDGWVASEAVAMAVYCAMRYSDDFAGAVRRAVNIPGDSDSVGSITGGLVAARLGLTAIPPRWTLSLEGSDYLTQLATRLAATKERLEKRE